MNKHIKLIELQAFIHAAKEYTIQQCVKSIETAVKTNQPDLEQLMRNAYKPYSYLPVIEKFFWYLGYKTRTGHPYDYVTYDTMMTFLDDKTKNILMQKGISLKWHS